MEICCFSVGLQPLKDFVLLYNCQVSVRMFMCITEGRMKASFPNSQFPELKRNLSKDSKKISIFSFQ